MDHDYQVSGLVIGCAIEVHKALGPGLKEKTYATTLCEVFDRRNIKFTCDRTIDVAFDGVKVGEYRPDLVVEGTVVVEVKSVLRMHPVFTSQVVTYLKITNLRVGLLLNFNCPRMKDGITRVVR